MIFKGAACGAALAQEWPPAQDPISSFLGYLLEEAENTHLSSDVSCLGSYISCFGIVVCCFVLNVFSSYL